MFRADDKIHSTKRCELSSVIITIQVRGSCLLGGCKYNLNCLIGVIMFVFHV
jgi:hypothetical protein